MTLGNLDNVDIVPKEAKRRTYIHKLQDELEAAKKSSKAAKDFISDLQAYLLSDKFSCGNELDHYVNIRDVLNRLEPILEHLRDIEDPKDRK